MVFKYILFQHIYTLSVITVHILAPDLLEAHRTDIYTCVIISSGMCKCLHGASKASDRSEEVRGVRGVRGQRR